MKTIAQDGPTADAIRENLKRIKLPEGFRIDLYAVVPDARHMAVGPSSGVVFVGTRKTDLWAVTDRTKNRTADEVKRFAPAISFTQPGPCFSPDGFRRRAQPRAGVPGRRILLRGAGRGGGHRGADRRADPRDEESYNHGARVCAISPTTSSPSPRPAAQRAACDKLELYERHGIGGIVRMERDGSKREVYATGVRNSVGITYHPTTKELWFTDNRVDGMGDETPPCEINHAPKAGMKFGMPWYGGGRAYQRVRRRNAARGPDPAGGGNHRPRRGHGPDLLHRQAVSRAVPRRAFQRPARQLEPHRAGGCAGDVHAVCGRWQRSVRRDSALRRRLAGRGNRRVLRPHRRRRPAQGWLVAGQ